MRSRFLKRSGIGITPPDCEAPVTGQLSARTEERVGAVRFSRGIITKMDCPCSAPESTMATWGNWQLSVPAYSFRSCDHFDLTSTVPQLPTATLDPASADVRELLFFGALREGDRRRNRHPQTGRTTLHPERPSNRDTTTGQAKSELSLGSVR
jgi:hypothetical protein